VEFTATLARLRAEHPTFRRKRFFTGSATADRLDDIVWLHPEGRTMTDDDWNGGQPVLAMYLNGSAIAGVDVTGGAITDDDFLLYFNGSSDPVELTLPPQEYAAAWDVVMDTAADAPAQDALAAGSQWTIQGRSALVLVEHSEAPVRPELSAAASVAAMAEQAG
jgi:glycogen operon protein